jgi:hypothetical protein
MSWSLFSEKMVLDGANVMNEAHADRLRRDIGLFFPIHLSGMMLSHHIAQGCVAVTSGRLYDITIFLLAVLGK